MNVDWVQDICREEIGILDGSNSEIFMFVLLYLHALVLTDIFLTPFQILIISYPPLLSL